MILVNGIPWIFRWAEILLSSIFAANSMNLKNIFFLLFWHASVINKFLKI
jgi:hypothetical protein